MNRNQLGQYWKCVVQDRDTFCPSRCDRCTICKDMNDVFVELQDAYFFCLNTTPANNKEPIACQSVLWSVFTNIIFYIQTAKSIPSYDLVLKDGKTC